MSVQTEKNVRTARLELRLSVQERERIEAKAKAMGMSLSDYIRMAALSFAPPFENVVANPPPLPPKLAEEVGKTHFFPAVLTPYKCPVQPACPFRAQSSAARCPQHGRLVIPA